MEMLHDQDLPMHLWTEAARTTVYVQNRNPHKVVENKTPEELFSGKKPKVSHQRIYFPGFKKIDISRYVTFDEDLAYNKSRKRPVEDSEETKVPSIRDTTMIEETLEED